MAGQLEVYDQIPAELRDACEDVILKPPARFDGPVAGACPEIQGHGEAAEVVDAECGAGRSTSAWSTRWLKAWTSSSSPTPRRRAQQIARPIEVIEGPLMAGMKSSATVRLGQDVPAPGGEERARDEEAVAHLLPYIEAQKTVGSRPKARSSWPRSRATSTTIGKNIVGVVLQCNNFEVIDLGVMVPFQDILKSANDNRPTSSASAA